MRAPIQQATNPLLLQLYPMEYCLAEGANTDSKNEHLENLRRDSWYFVPLYTVSFIFLGLAVFCAGGLEWLYGIVILILAVFAAQCDLLENHHLEQCLDGDLTAAYAAYAWARWKWAALSFALAASAPQLFTQQSWRRALRLLLMVGGGVGIVALLPTEKIAPFLRHLLVPLFLLNLILIWLICAADLAWQDQSSKKPRREELATKTTTPPRKKREQRKPKDDEASLGETKARTPEKRQESGRVA